MFHKLEVKGVSTFPRKLDQVPVGVIHDNVEIIDKKLRVDSRLQ